LSLYTYGRSFLSSIKKTAASTLVFEVNQLGFDTVDSGSLSDSWRKQPGTPAYCTELTKEERTKALEKAIKKKPHSYGIR